MPHDRDGTELRVGHIVMVPARVKEIHQTEDYCNVTLETCQDMYPTRERSILNLNAKQVVKHADR